MPKVRIRPLGHLWSTVTVSGNADESEQFLSLFSDALRTVPELRGFPRDLDEYAVFWTRRQMSVYHESVEGGAVFLAKPATP
ncbi:hypothetical protein CTZ27_30205 [Streptomyces griseocarneus]|nr:hypothetical protein CTZ27_30205 [Streptomyces griseocarneus]